MIRIYVGNLNYRTSEDGLRSLFGEHGQVDSVAIITDRQTGRSRGFAFVEMTDDAQAKAAIEALHGQEFEDRRLTVNEARPRTQGNGRDGGGGGGRDGGGRGGRDGGGHRDRY